MVSAGCLLASVVMLSAGLSLNADQVKDEIAKNRDRRTGLVIEKIDEALPAYLGSVGEWASVDRNVTCARSAVIAANALDKAGKKDEAHEMRTLARQLYAAVERNLWDKKECVFKAKNLKTKEWGPKTAEMFEIFFDPLLPRDRRVMLLAELENWKGEVRPEIGARIVAALRFADFREEADSFRNKFAKDIAELPSDESWTLQAKAQWLVDESVRLGKQVGVQFAAYIDGKPVIDVAAGYLTLEDDSAPVTSSSLFPIFSTEKPLLATAVHRAVEKGKMAYDKPLYTWWPEFKGGEKDKLTLGLTLAYRSGMPGANPAEWPLKDQCNWKKICEWAAQADPEIEPGTTQRYMPRAYAWMLGHPLEVAMGKPLNDVLVEEVLKPAGIADEFYFVQDETVWPRIADFYGARYCEVMNTRQCRRMCLPSSFAVASARSLCRFYTRLCGFDGKAPLIRKETLDNALKLSRHESDPLPPDEVFNDEKQFTMVFGMGYGLWGDSSRPDRVFGHGGAGGSEALVDRDQHLVVGFTCNVQDPYTYETLRPKLYELVNLRWRYWKSNADIQTIQMKSQQR